MKKTPAAPEPSGKCKKESGGGGDRTTEFKGYDLSALPEAALPFDGQVYKGAHSYTVNVGDAVS